MNVTRCHFCGSHELSEVLDLGFHPLADFFLKKEQISERERRYPLTVLLCKNCGLAMNSYVVSKEERYQENDYSYDSSNSKIAIKHFTDMAADIATIVGVQKGDLVVDIGSNVGTLLSAFKTHGAEIQGVEPAPNIAAIAQKDGVPTVNNFFGFEACTEILKRGRAKVITATNCFNHIAYPDEFMWGIASILRDDGVFVIEFPYFLQLLKRRHFDTIYLEHVTYPAAKSLATFVQKFGLTLVHVEENDYMSGSVRYFIGRGQASESVAAHIAAEEAAGLFSEQTFKVFAQQIRQCKLDLLKELVAARTTGGKIVAIGAAAKGNTLLNYCGIDKTLVDFATDASPLKIGKYTPGSHLPILSDDAIDSSVTHALILAWNIADFLKNKIGPKHPHLKFITPHVVE